MKYKFSKNSNGSWVVHNNTDGMPVGSITADGKLFYVAHYNGMTIENSLMRVISTFMSVLSKEEFEIEEFAMDGSRMAIEIKRK